MPPPNLSDLAAHRGLTIALDSSHPLNPHFILLPSGHRYKSSAWRKIRFSKTFIPVATTELNTKNVVRCLNAFQCVGSGGYTLVGTVMSAIYGLTLSCIYVFVICVSHVCAVCENYFHILSNPI